MLRGTFTKAGYIYMYRNCRNVLATGAEMHPHGVPGRVVLGLWWVFTILTSASYTANLAAFLTINMNAVPINTIYELAQQSQVKPLVKNGTNLYTLFQVTKICLQ